jgi:TrmH family RNA methyltransferase
MEIITSLQNSKIKNLRLLGAKARERQAQGLFVIEGDRELSLALAGGYGLEAVYVCRALFAGSRYPDVLQTIPTPILYEVSEEVFRTMAYREGTGGIVALARPRPHRLADLPLSSNPFLIVLEAVEKPGNLGAILRTADAAQADGVIVCDAATDIYNPNVVRSSVGCLFTVPLAIGTNEETRDFLRTRGICTYAADLTAAEDYRTADFTAPSAIVMGTEAEGLTDFWRHGADRRVKIPMRGVIDSLNVSVATAVLTFEAMRRREGD